MRGRRVAAIVAAGLLALAGAGCGGDDDLAPEVPGPPADVVIPESAEAPTEAAGQDDAATQDTGEDTSGGTTEPGTTEPGTTDDTGTTDGTGTTDDTGTTVPEEATPVPDDTGTTTTPDGSGGTTAPDGEADSPTNDTPPPEGSNAEQFEDFCAQNPGAC